LQADERPFCATPADDPDPVVVGDAWLGEDGAFALDANTVQEKAFWVTDGTTAFFVPSFYGTYKQATTVRCSSSLPDWPANCAIPQNRKMRIDIDAESCEAISEPYSWPLVDAVIEWQEYMRAYHGWDITIGGPLTTHQPNAKLECDELVDAFGMVTRTSTTCWNLPGYPKDLCLGAQSGASGYGMVVEIDLAAILQETFDPLKRHPLIRNIVWHELGHAAGLGHAPGYDGTRIMNNGITPHMLAGFMSFTSTEKSTFSNFSRTGNACNWQPGDAVGDSCPSQ
jgi:hypothetical protein